MEGYLAEKEKLIAQLEVSIKAKNTAQPKPVF
jgi:hypothetical protein